MLSRDPRFVAASSAVEVRVQALVSAMTLTEKILLLGGQPGVGSTHGVPRLGVPELRLADGPLGVHWWCDASTAYPATIAAAATWDPALWYRLGSALGRDCRARGVHILLAPGVNIYRSPLCARNFEYAGEDPYLSSRFAVGYIQGVQDMGVSATVKHYACNFQEYERHHVSSDVDERTLHEVYLSAFRAAVTEAGVGAVMTAYNLLNGVHCSEHPGLIRDILKGDWGFQGVVMSDWISTYSAVGAANAGLDLEMPEAEWLNEAHIVPAIEAGSVSIEVIDDKVRRLLRLAACFGWLEHPQQDPSIPLDDPETAAVALDVARASVVLLRNEGSFLPFDRRKLRSLAVLGFGAHPAVISGGGSAYAPPWRATSILEGLREACGSDVEILHAPGPEASPDRELYRESVFECSAGAGLWGEYFDNNELSGAPAASRLDAHVDFFWGKQKPVPEISVRQYSVRWSGAIVPEQGGRHLFYSRCRNGHYRIFIGGRAIIDTWERERNGMHRAELTLEAGRRYDVLIEWRKTRVSGNMKFGWRHAGGPVPGLAECVQAAERADAAVLCVGFDAITESEGYDREFRMGEELEQLVLAVARAQPNTVVVLTAGGNVDMSAWIDRVRAVLHAWYPGQAGGRAIAEILLGHVNPEGRLPATFEARLEDRSSFASYHDDDGDRRVELSDGIFTGYRHVDRSGIEPRFPFGYGLGYTSFAYERLELSTTVLSPGERLALTVTVRNTGERAGAEVVQLYVRERNPRLPRPYKELKAFRKVWVEAGASARAVLEIGISALEFFDPDARRWTHQSGEFELLVGPNARDIALRARVTAL
jgi:beta-glucosidase